MAKHDAQTKDFGSREGLMSRISWFTQLKLVFEKTIKDPHASNLVGKAEFLATLMQTQEVGVITIANVGLTTAEAGGVLAGNKGDRLIFARSLQ